MRKVVALILLMLLSAQADPLIDEVRSQVQRLGSERAAHSEYEQFARKHKLTSLNYWTYLKNKVAFEACRDAGLWHIGYDITDQEPNSDQIWRQWSNLSGAPGPRMTARAECDEISALYAHVAHRLGVSRIGLFWPTSNHTVAVWSLKSQMGVKRVVVPTTPIFLERDDGFDAQGFDPWTQSVIYDYTRQEAVRPLSSGLVRFFGQQIYNYGGAGTELLHELRYAREAFWYGELKPESVEGLKKFNSLHDRRALKTFSKQFLGWRGG